jgi:hypothetical protein
MTGTNPVDAGVLPALWRRAPLWRGAVLMAGAFTLLTVTLVWQSQALLRGRIPLPAATYTPRSVPGAAPTSAAVPPRTAPSIAASAGQGLSPRMSLALGADRSLPVPAFQGAPPEAALLAWPGDSLAKIQATYPGSPAPTPYHSSDPADRQEVWLRDQGVRFFLTIDGVIHIVRLDRPFAGAVHGVRLGDGLDEVERRLGSAGQQLGAARFGGLSSSYLFAADPRYRVRVDVDADQRVRTVFLIR